MSRIIASEFVGHQPPGFSPLVFDETAEKPFGRALIAMALYENIKGIAVLIDRAPEILSLAMNRDKDFFDVPGIAQASLLFFELACVGRPKLPAPLSNGFIGDGDASFSQEFFDFTKAEAESMVEPHGVADNFRGKTMTLIAGCWLFHAAQSAKCELN